MVIDGRTLSHDSLETIRKIAVRRVLAGEKPSAVIKSFGFCRTSIYRWLRASAKGGVRALRSTKASGRRPHVSLQEAQAVRRWITGRDPRQFGFDFGLWTRRIIAELINDRFGKRIGLTAVGRLLAELGVTPQKPLRRAYERDRKAIELWKTKTYPSIRKRGRRRHAEIFFLDEAGVRSDVPLGRTWAPKGKTPIVQTSGQRQSINAISAVNPNGAFWWLCYTGHLNATRFIEFVEAFLKRRRTPVIMILDRHPAHVAKAVARFIKKQAGKIEFFFLPGYAPELNPDEFVWNHVKNNGVAKKPLRHNESLRERVSADLAAIKSDVKLVKSFFLAESVAYVRD